MRDGKAHSLTNFNEFDEIKQYLIDVAANTANAEYKTFGKSFEGRDMIAIEIGTGSKVYHLFLIKLISRLFANIFHHLKFDEEHKSAYP